MCASEQNGPVLRRRSTRRHIPNIHRQGALTLSEAAELRAGLARDENNATIPESTPIQPIEDPAHRNLDGLPEESPDRFAASTMSASSLFANLFPSSGEARVAEQPEVFATCEPVDLPAVAQTPSPRLDSPDLPLFYVDPPSPTVEYEAPPVQNSTPPPPLPTSVYEDGSQELQAQEEIRQQFRWLTDMLNENRRRGWGTGYRDFVDVLLLLRAVGGLGMVEQGNNRVSNGVFSASTGDFALSLMDFINMMDLEHTSATWRNKLTTYFRLKSLHSYSRHTGGIEFRDPTHRYAWGVVSHWMEHQDKVLQEGWITVRFGSTELRPLLRDMLQEAYQGGMEYMEEFN